MIKIKTRGQAEAVAHLMGEATSNDEEIHLAQLKDRSIIVTFLSAIGDVNWNAMALQDGRIKGG